MKDILEPNEMYPGFYHYMHENIRMPTDAQIVNPLKEGGT